MEAYIGREKSWALEHGMWAANSKVTLSIIAKIAVKTKTYFYFSNGRGKFTSGTVEITVE